MPSTSITPTTASRALPCRCVVISVALADKYQAAPNTTIANSTSSDNEATAPMNDAIMPARNHPVVEADGERPSKLQENTKTTKLQNMKRPNGGDSMKVPAMR